MEWVGIVVPGAVGALGGGGVVGLFRYLRESKEQTRREAGDIRAEIRSTYEKDIELANALGKDQEADRLRRDYLEFDERWRAEQTLESLVPREVQQAGPTLSDEAASRLLALLESTWGLPTGVVTPEGHLLRGNAFYESKEYRSAANEYTEAIRGNPDYADAFSNRGRAFGRLNLQVRAIQDFDEAIRLKSGFATAYSNRGSSYGSLGQFGRAIEDFDESISLDPGYPTGLYNRGTAYHNLDQHEFAIKDFDEAIRLDPAYNNRGTAKVSLREFESAIEDYNVAISLDPKYASAYNGRGSTYAMQGEYD